MCIGGDRTKLVLDYKTLKVSGSVTLNGKKPVFKSSCKNGGSSSNYMTVRLYEKKYAYSYYIYRSCYYLNKFGWTFENLSVAPGSYKISVVGSSTRSNLPGTWQVIHDDFPITKDTTNLVLDYKTLKVSGSVTLNSKTPVFTSSCKNGGSSSNYMTVRLYEVCVQLLHLPILLLPQQVRLDV